MKENRNTWYTIRGGSVESGAWYTRTRHRDAETAGLVFEYLTFRVKRRHE
jgi:hypothetical protein